MNLVCNNYFLELFKFNLYGKFEKFWPDLDCKDSIDTTKLVYIIRIKAT